ncbi:MAG: MotA/TolQ/ExbB proton channel family protein [Ignavibacteriota bacterium]
MKKNSTFVAIVILGSFVVAFLIWQFVLGNPSNFSDPLVREKPLKDSILGLIYVGGFLVPVLIGLSLMVFSFVAERFLSLAKAKGKKDLTVLLPQIEKLLNEGKFDAVIDLCNQQKGTVANILRAGITRFKEVQNNPSMSPEMKSEEVKKTLEEVTMLETPLLEQNLVILSTIASISTMIGLLGTVLGMIRSFRALGEGGAGSSATALSVGISEALWNTALGIGGAIIAIVFYNFFTNKVDKFVYLIDEASLNLLETIKVRFLGKSSV